jgi:hypothetical protein
MKKGISLAAALILIAVALLLSWMWRIRAMLPYNEMGRYYDSANSVVYTDSAVAVLGMLAVAVAMAALAAMLWAARTWRR